MPWLLHLAAALVGADGAGSNRNPASLCRNSLLVESSPTLIPEPEMEMWASSDTPGTAPPEQRLDAMSAYWERCDAAGGKLWEVLAPESPTGVALCAPAACRQREVAHVLWPQRLQSLGVRSGNASRQAMATELGHWKQLHLDFVLAGFEKCGTSSLSHNLARHPQAEFIPTPSEDPRINGDKQLAQDGNLFWHVGNRLLPPAELVASFNAGLCCSGGARVDGFSNADLIGAARDRGDAHHVKRGERNPVYAFHRVIMKMVALVPGAKVVLLACDPIRWLHSAYGDTMNWYAGAEGDPPPPPVRDFALSDFVPAPVRTSLSEMWYNLSRRRAYFTFFAEGVARILGSERVLMMHRDSVDSRHTDPAGIRQAYDRLAAFLGLRSFSPDFAFERRNSRRVEGGASMAAPLALCEASEAKALKVLRRYYRAEYSRLPAWLSKLGGLVPPRVAANRSCCDA